MDRIRHVAALVLMALFCAAPAVANGSCGGYLEANCPTPVPEPTSLALIATGIAGIALARRFRGRR